MNTLIKESAVLQPQTYINNTEIPELELVERELLKAINELENPVRDMCNYVINSGGKRLRPLLMLNCGQCFGPVNSNLIKAAVAAELIHLASLVHDDILDNSNLRHKKATLNSGYGNHISVLVGDCLFAKAFQILASNKIYNGLEYMTQTIYHMCEGEIFQAANIKSASLSLNEYYKRIEKKTACLISACCKTGAAINSLGHKHIHSMEMFGLYLGCAYQIIDDILDFQGNKAKLGKPIFNDLLQGNITLPAIFLLEHKGYQEIIDMVITKRVITKEIKLIILAGLNETGALNKAYAAAAEFCNKALLCLEDVPDNPYRQYLMSLPEALLNRCC